MRCSLTASILLVFGLGGFAAAVSGEPGYVPAPQPPMPMVGYFGSLPVPYSYLVPPPAPAPAVVPTAGFLMDAHNPFPAVAMPVDARSEAERLQHLRKAARHLRGRRARRAGRAG